MATHQLYTRQRVINTPKTVQRERTPHLRREKHPNQNPSMQSLELDQPPKGVEILAPGRIPSSPTTSSSPGERQKEQTDHALLVPSVWREGEGMYVSRLSWPLHRTKGGC